MSGRVANTKDIIQFKNVKNRVGVKQEANASAKIELDEAMVDQVGTMKDVVAKVMSEWMNEWMNEWIDEWVGNRHVMIKGAKIRAGWNHVESSGLYAKVVK